jgi:hypothetical protein
MRIIVHNGNNLLYVLREIMSLIVKIMSIIAVLKVLKASKK